MGTTYLLIELVTRTNPALIHTKGIGVVSAAAVRWGQPAPRH